MILSSRAFIGIRGSMGRGILLKIMDWINTTGNRSAAFDFTTKWQLMLAVENNEYWRLTDAQGNPIGASGSQWAVWTK